MRGRIFEKAATVRAGATVSAELVVTKDIVVGVRGYVLAVRRLEDALDHEGAKPDEVYIAIFEAGNLSPRSERSLRTLTFD